MPRSSRPTGTTRRPLAGLAGRSALTALAVALLLVAGTLTAPAHAYREDLGQLTMKSRFLKHGCHDYRYRYAVDPPPGDWALEIFLVHKRSGTSVAHGGVVGGQEATSGVRRFRLCRPSTRPGRYVVRGRLSVQDAFDYREWWIRPDHFRFYRRR